MARRRSRNGQVVRKQVSGKLAEVCDRFRSKADVRPLLVEKLRPLNERRTRPEGTLQVSEFVENYYLPFAEENFKPSTAGGYKSLWKMYLSARLDRIIVRDFRTVDAGGLLADIHREHKVGTTTLKHIKSFLSGVFTFAKNQGAFDGVNPVRDAMIPKKAGKPLETYAVSPDEVLAMMETLNEAGQPKAGAAVGLIFFAGLRPGEARGVRWEDLDGRRLHVRQSVWHTHATSPKTVGSEKSVPVIEPLALILADLRELDKNPASGPILRGPSGKPLDLNNLAARIVVPILREAGIKWHGWYALRRGVATAISALSKGSLAAKGLLRHSSVSTTERHYIKDVPESTLQAMEQLEALCKDRGKEVGLKPG